MKKKLTNPNLYALFLVAAQFCLVVYTWHDVAVAQGVGLYYAMQVGSENRLLFDLLADAACAVCFVMVILLPAVLSKYGKPVQILRFVSVYLAFMPVLRPAMLVHLFDGHSLWTVKFDGALSVNLLFGFVREAIPLLFILAILCRLQGFAVPKWHLGILVSELVLCLGMSIFPEVSEVCQFLMYYLMAVMAFDQWEKLLAKETSRWGKVMSWLLFALFYLRGCERMLTLMAAYHL